MTSLAVTNPDLTSKKRRFQPPITTFFPTNPDGSSSPSLSHNHYSAPTSSATPIVSAKDQTSLLQVGMRIRKAVPEGYKTKPVEKTSTDVFSNANENGNGNGSAGYTELAPFSGMSKISDQRPVESLSNTTTSFPVSATTDDGDAFSLPSSSQTSTLSSTSLPSGHKRPCDDDAETENLNDDSIDSSGDIIFHDGSPVSSNLNLGLPAPSPTINRPILAPTIARQKRQVLATQLSLGQSSAAANAGMDVDDFEEPVFLRRREEVDAEYLSGQKTGWLG